MKPELNDLMPVPKQGSVTDTPCFLPGKPLIFVAGDHRSMLPALEGIVAELAGLDARAEITATRNQAIFVFQVDTSLDLGPEGYVLEIDEKGVRVTGTGKAGLFYGIQTLRQWIRRHSFASKPKKRFLHGLAIRDRPDFPHRGVMLDISRDKVPAMETLFALVDLLAGWKINQFQLYMEHTFAYAGHETVWQNAGALTGEEIRALDAYCRARFVELVPNQNSFGHFHRWLIHEAYRGLAECPEGVAHPFSTEVEPFSLCPGDPRVLDLLADLYAQLLPHFSSTQCNVGLDETFDLGLGRSKAACAHRGKEEVYLDFLKKVCALVRRYGRRMQFWGDIIIKRPDLISALPRDAIALEWGYEADHPFEKQTRAFADSGLDFYVCPGTGSWQSISGRTHNTLLNLAGAAFHGKNTGALGYLITDWGDFGHLQPLPISFPGMLAGAGFSWNTALSEHPLSPDWPAHLDHYAFEDRNRIMGRQAYDLGNVYLEYGAKPTNGTALFFLIRFAEDTMEHSRLQGLTIESLDRVAALIETIRKNLEDAACQRTDAQLLYHEYRWTAALLLWCCRFGRARLAAGSSLPVHALPGRTRKSLAHELDDLVDAHRMVWLKRNRREGLTDSCRKLERIRELLLP